MPSALRVLDALRRRLLIHRRGVVALCVAILCWSVITTLKPATPPGEVAWTAAHDLPSGTVLAPDDLVRTTFAVGTVPRAAHGLTSLVGRTLATPLVAGEVAMAGQTVGNQRLAGYPGRSAVPIRIPDADAVGLLHPGDRVDLVGSDPQQHRAAGTVARDAIVLAVPRTPSRGSTAALTGRLVVFAIPTDQVLEVAAAASALFLTVIWNR